MEIGNIIEFEDKIICLSEVQFSRIYERTQHSTTPSNSTKTGDAILSIYDSKLTLLDQQVIPKYIEYFGTEGIYTTIYIHDQTLVIVSGVRTGTFSVLPFFINYDLKQNKITRQDSPERGSIKKSIALSFDPSCTLWFEKSFVISYQRELGFSVSKNIASDLQKFNY